MPGREQPVAYSRARGKRHVVLGGAPAGEHRHREPLASRKVRYPETIAHPGGSVGGGSVVVVVVVVLGVVVVVVVCCASVPTAIVTVVPLRAFSLPAGLCPRTRPTWDCSVVTRDSGRTLNPACSSVAVAAA